MAEWTGKYHSASFMLMIDPHYQGQIWIVSFKLIYLAINGGPFLAKVCPHFHALGVRCGPLHNSASDQSILRVWFLHRRRLDLLPGRQHKPDTLLLGNRLNSFDSAFLLRCASIWLITEVSSILEITLTAPPHASQVEISILNTRLRRCAQVIEAWRFAGVPSSVLLSSWCFFTFAAFCRCYQSTMFAVWRENTMESSQVNPGLRHQGNKPSHEMQWLEDDVGSAIPIRCLQLIADVAAWRKRRMLKNVAYVTYLRREVL